MRPALKGTLKRALDHVRHAFDGGAVEIAVRDVRAALCISDRNFRRDVTAKPEWHDALDRLGVKQESGYRGRRCCGVLGWHQGVMGRPLERVLGGWPVGV